MQEFATAFAEAFHLIAAGDGDLLEIVGLSLRISLTAVVISCVIGFPLGAVIGIGDFRGRQCIIVCVNALMGLPPVVVEKNGGLELQLGELEVTLDTPGGELGDHLVASVNVFAPVEIYATDGVVKLDLGDPTLVMMVRESDWGADDVTITELLEVALPLDLLLGLLNIEYPLPSLAFLASLASLISLTSPAFLASICALRNSKKSGLSRCWTAVNALVRGRRTRMCLADLSDLFGCRSRIVRSASRHKYRPRHRMEDRSEADEVFAKISQYYTEVLLSCCPADPKQTRSC